jgi:hypothetical protein
VTSALPRRILVGAAAVLAFLLVAGIIAASMAGHRKNGPQAQAPPTTAATPARSSKGFTPVAPLRTQPAETPVQEQYDDALASGLGSSASIKVAEAAQVPEPAFSADRPALAAANTPELWVQEFTQALLDIDFAHQSRASLGAWVSAEAAPELLPGVPSDVQNKVLYLSLFEAGVFGGSSPIPDQSTWDADARSGVQWSVSNLTVQTDPRYSQIVATGWQPVDQRFVVEDATGILNVTTGGSTTQQPFSMAVYAGSAHWHQGYGTVLVDDWKET